MCTSEDIGPGPGVPSAGPLRALSRELADAFPDAVFVPVRLIGGKRWEALERLPGNTAEWFPVDLPHLIECAPEWGIMVYGWSGLDAGQQTAIEALIRAQ